MAYSGQDLLLQQCLDNRSSISLSDGSLSPALLVLHVTPSSTLNKIDFSAAIPVVRLDLPLSLAYFSSAALLLLYLQHG